MTLDTYFGSAFNFWKSDDVISRFARISCRAVGFLVSLAGLGACIWLVGSIVGLGTALIGDWTYAIILPILGYLLVRLRDLLTDSFFAREVLLTFLYCVTGLIALGCSLYILFINPLTILLLLGVIALYLVLIFIEEWLKAALRSFPPLVRRIIASVVRAKREFALMAAIGFAFVLTTQIDVITWAAFGQDAIWIWEHLLRPVSSLPKPSIRVFLALLLSLALLSALKPQHRFVERGLKAIKVYKTTLALFATLASFTFLTSASISSLRGHLLLKETSPLKDASKESRSEFISVDSPRAVMIRAAWICFRLESTTPEERNRAASELFRLPEAKQHGWVPEAAKNMAAQLDEQRPGSPSEGPPGSAAEAYSTNQDRPKSVVDESYSQKVYSEAKQAVTTVLSELIKHHASAPHLDNDLLSSFTSDLLASVTASLPDAALPKNIRDFAELRDRLKPLWPKTFGHSLAGLRLDPDWDAILSRANVQTPRWGLNVVFENGGKFATDILLEPETVDIGLGAARRKPRLTFWEWVIVAGHDLEEIE